MTRPIVGEVSVRPIVGEVSVDPSLARRGGKVIAVEFAHATGVAIVDTGDWYIAKRRGNKVRWRNRKTGAWDRWEDAPWSPFGVDGGVRADLADEGFVMVGAISEDGIE